LGNNQFTPPQGTWGIHNSKIYKSKIPKFWPIFLELLIKQPFTFFNSPCSTHRLSGSEPAEMGQAHSVGPRSTGHDQASRAQLHLLWIWHETHLICVNPSRACYSFHTSGEWQPALVFPWALRGRLCATWDVSTVRSLRQHCVTVRVCCPAPLQIYNAPGQEEKQEMQPEGHVQEESLPPFKKV
jgi:hypothetical protein